MYMKIPIKFIAMFSFKKVLSMIIRSSKEYLFLCVLLFCCVLGFSGIMYAASHNVLFSVLILLVLAYTVFRYWVSVGRILTLNEEGCTVQFLWISRFYRWKDMKTIQIEDYTNSLGYRQPYKTGIVFSPRKIRKPKWLMPAEYSFFVHPFSCIYIYFDPHLTYSKWDYRCPDIYLAEEVVFIQKMLEWHVELSDKCSNPGFSKTSQD